MTEDERLFKVALTFVPGLGDILIRQLVSYCGSASAVFKTPKGKLLKIPGIGEKNVAALLNTTWLGLAEAELKKVDERKVKLLFFTDPEYPAKLRQIPDAPVMLYYSGNANLNNPSVISIVGTRKATDYGKDFVNEIVQDLKPFNPLVVSGLAYGIDIAVHKACLEHGLETIGVMGSGVDIIYPSQHKKTAQQMTEQGGLLSEYKMGVSPEAFYFPARNRIVAGMADATIVVEAAKGGGALITADLANDYNKEVFAVPGNLGSKYSEGCNALIRDNKAHIYTGVKDLELILSTKINEKENRIKEYAGLSEEEQSIVKLLQENKEMLIDEFGWKSQFNISIIASLLLGLEFKGIVKSLPGKKYTLSK